MAPKGRHELIRRAHPKPQGKSGARPKKATQNKNPARQQEETQRQQEETHPRQAPKTRPKDKTHAPPNPRELGCTNMTHDHLPKRPKHYQNTTSPIFTASKFPLETQTKKGTKGSMMDGNRDRGLEEFQGRKGHKNRGKYRRRNIRCVSSFERESGNPGL